MCTYSMFKYLLIFPVFFMITAEAQEADQPLSLNVEVLSKPDSIDSFSQEDFKDDAKIRISNRITAQNVVIILKKETPYVYDDTEITLHSCWRAPLTRKPESAALLSVLRSQLPESAAVEAKKDEDLSHQETNNEPMFYGWIYASSPSVIYVRHPIYTFRLLECGALPIEETNNDAENSEENSVEDALNLD